MSHTNGDPRQHNVAQAAVVCDEYEDLKSSASYIEGH